MNSLSKNKKQIIITVILAIALGLSSFYLQTQKQQAGIRTKKDAIMSYQIAKDYVYKKEYGEALKFFEDAVKGLPDNPAILADMGLTYKLYGDLDNAKKCLKKSISLNSKEFNSYLVLADIYNIQSNYKASSEILNKAITIGKEHKNLCIAYNLLGHSYLQSGNYKDANLFINRALQLDPSYIDARNNLGLIYLKKGELDKAKKCFILTSQLYKSHPDAKYYQAYIAYKKGEIGAALNKIETIKHLTPDYVRAYYLAGIIHAKQKHTNKAFTSFSRMLQLEHPYISSAEYNIILKDSLEALTGLQKHDDTFIALADLIASIHLKLNEPDKAIQIYQNVIKKGYDYPELHNNLAAIYLEKNDHKNAMSEYKKAIGQRPKNALFHYGLANLHKKQKQYDKAEAEFLKTLQIDPAFSLAEVNLGDIYKMKKDNEKSTTHYRNALKLNPSEAYAYLGLGDLYYSKGLYEDALWNYEMFVKYSPPTTMKYAITQKISDIKSEID